MIQIDNSERSGPISVAFDGNVLDLCVEETFLHSACLHEILWLAIRDAIEQHPYVKIVLIDFSQVKQVTSLTISVLIRTNTYLSQQGRTLGLYGMNSSIRNVFRTVRLDGIIPAISESREGLLPPAKPHTYFEAYAISEIHDLSELE